MRNEISSQTLDGKTVLVVHVPEAQPQDKPVFFRAQGLPRGAFRRISAATPTRVIGSAGRWRGWKCLRVCRGKKVCRMSNPGVA